jgi:hypothetical protein
MKFGKFKKYIVEENKKGNKHTFHKVNFIELLEIEKKIFIPKELKEFYINIGYGCFYDNLDSFSIDNLREDYYSDDPTLDFYNQEKFKNYKIFIEVVEGNYLLIDDNEIEGKNAIIYIDTKIADSLEEFLNRFDKEGHYFE